ARRRVEEGGERYEEEERGTQVALVDQDEEAPGPHQEQRHQLPRLRNPDRSQTAVGPRQRRLPVGQVGGQERHEQDLGDFGRLEMQFGESEMEDDPEAAAVL